MIYKVVVSKSAEKEPALFPKRMVERIVAEI
jgi:hypothetical protein